LVGESVVDVLELFEDTEIASCGVIVDVDDGGGGVVWLGNFKNLNVPVFYQVRPEGDGEVVSGFEVGEGAGSR
jgi:hypothetical protein